MNTLKRNFSLRCGLTLVLFSLVAAGHAADVDTEQQRTTVTSQGLVSEGGANSDKEPRRDQYKSLSVSGSRSKPARSDGQQKLSDGRTASPNVDFWIYSVDVELFLDRDRDGYFTGIDLQFDADTYYDAADVYAVLYLSYEYGPWNEYAETEIFSIYGAAAGDEYGVETDLVEGYPTGDYDILIELYDTYDNALVATLGPEDSSQLSILPLEDVGRDAPAGTTQIVVNQGGGGALGWLLIPGLLVAGALRRSRR